MAATFESSRILSIFRISTISIRWRSRDGTRCWPDKRHTASGNLVPPPSRHLHKFDLLRLQNSSHLSLCTDVQVVHELRRHHWVVLPAFRNATVPPEQEFVFVLRSPSRSGLLPFSPGPLATVWLLIRERGGRRCVGEFSSTDGGFSDVQGWNRSVWRNSLE